MKRLAFVILGLGLFFSLTYVMAQTGTGVQHRPPISICDPTGTSCAAVTAGVLSTSASGSTTGAAANGAAVSGNPVLVAGYDGTLVRTVKTDTAGQVQTLPVGSISIAGTASSAKPVLVGGMDGANGAEMLPLLASGDSISGAHAIVVPIGGRSYTAGLAYPARVGSSTHSLSVLSNGTGAPAVPTNVSVSNASAGTTFAAGACLRLTCSTAASYRIGAGAQTAVATDNDLPANVIEKVCSGANTGIAFITSGATGTCKVASFTTED